MSVGVADKALLKKTSISDHSICIFYTSKKCRNEK
jgi:hypothetical protein